MAQALFYSSNAVAMTLAAGMASGDVSCSLSSVSGLPASFPYKLLIGWGTGQQEVVHCTALSGTTATVVRGQDGTTAQAHSIGAAVVHGVSAREFNDLELHVGSTSGVHGITGSVVGTTDAQDLTNKTVSGSPLVGTTTAQTLSNKTLSSPTINTPTITSPFFNGLSTFSATSDGAVAVTAKPFSATATGHIQDWTNASSVPLAFVTAKGQFAAGAAGSIPVNGAGFAPGITGFPIDPAGAALAAKGTSAQTGNLIETWDITGNLLAAVDAKGRLSFNTLAVPTTSGFNAGISTATRSGNDQCGVIAITTNPSGVAAFQNVVTVTFGTPFPGTPVIALAEQDASGLGVIQPFNITSSGFSITTSSPMAASTTFHIGYIVMGYR